jgi:hypothetical protein
MNKTQLRLDYEKLFEPHRSTGWDAHKLNSIWRTHHSLQLTRLGFHLLTAYTKHNKINLLNIEIQNGRSVGELLSIANTLDTPYFIAEKHLANKIQITTLESDRAAMLVMQNGNVLNWAAMYRND